MVKLSLVWLAACVCSAVFSVVALAREVPEQMFASGTAKGAFRVFCLDARTVLDLLPDELRLAEPPEPVCEEGRHPAVVFFGTQNQLRAHVAGIDMPIPGASFYREIIFMIPSVKSQGFQQVYAYIPRIDVSSIMALKLAVQYGGLNKVYTTIDALGPHDIMSFSKDDTERFWGRSMPVLDYDQGAVIENFAKISWIFDQKSLTFRFGKPYCYTFDWRIRAEAIVPSRVKFRLGETFLNDSSLSDSIDSLHISSHTMAGSPLGGFVTEHQWEMETGLTGHCR